MFTLLNNYNSRVVFLLKLKKGSRVGGGEWYYCKGEKGKTAGKSYVFCEEGGGWHAKHAVVPPSDILSIFL